MPRGSRDLRLVRVRLLHEPGLRALVVLVRGSPQLLTVLAKLSAQLPAPWTGALQRRNSTILPTLCSQWKPRLLADRLCGRPQKQPVKQSSKSKASTSEAAASWQETGFST